LASLVLYPTLKDKESGFVMTVVDPHVFPIALRGLMIAAFAAAYMSTIATQLNWGASYVVSDVYRRFLVPKAPDKHYVNVSQVVTLLLMILSCVVTYYQNSISDAWKFLMAIGAGTGAVLILRWFWWRINAWSEIAAMGTSLIVSILLEFWIFKSVYVFPTPDDPRRFAYTVLITVGCTTVVWLAVTFMTPPENDAVLLNFYRRVRPSASLWGPIAKQATDVVPVHDGVSNLRDWVLGCMMVYMTLFGVGKLIFGEIGMGLGFLAIAVSSGIGIYYDLQRRGWNVVGQTEAAEELAT
jgi:Na+/proline symporter